ncbi:hypothetical protein QVD17_07981 [Tagetes erecta]|uniref:Uncharacterized protein n=1 Tax=Tagetes erecta TaxID=13708 RepID=A0AAD8P4C6_TARER|nr:hypothetical protein QVD17_07981 [Tagetes erecta]
MAQTLPTSFKTLQPFHHHYYSLFPVCFPATNHRSFVPRRHSSVSYLHSPSTGDLLNLAAEYGTLSWMCEISEV